jgi:hypothetical protein
MNRAKTIFALNKDVAFYSDYNRRLSGKTLYKDLLINNKKRDYINSIGNKLIFFSSYDVFSKISKNHYYLHNRFVKKPPINLLNGNYSVVKMNDSDLGSCVKYAQNILYPLGETYIINDALYFPSKILIDNECVILNPTLIEDIDPNIP